MKRLNKTILTRRIKAVLGSSEGASIILVTIISILIITAVIILRITTSSLWASAGKQYNQDKAYMMATTLGESIEDLLNSGTLTDLTTMNGKSETVEGADVTIAVVENGDYYTLTVTSTVAGSVYQYKAVYKIVRGSYMRVG